MEKEINIKVLETIAKEVLKNSEFIEEQHRCFENFLTFGIYTPNIDIWLKAMKLQYE